MSVESSLKRKDDHIDLCHTGDVGLAGDPGLFSQVRLIHQAMPELAMADLDLRTAFLDHELSMPVMLTGMTGGPERAGAINRDLATLCESNGMAFGVGSQRIITSDSSTVDSFSVRSQAPNVCLLGNIGINQARDLGPQTVLDLFERIEANYMAIHLNPAMELIQPGAEADSNFRDGFDTIARLVDALDGKLIVKECGCGLSASLVQRLKNLGVRGVDVSGVGGTSWIRVEALRAEGIQADIGFDFDDWGIPTAVTTWAAGRVDDMMVVSSGGVYSGRTAAKALALGADLVGVARPVLQAYLDHGVDGAQQVVDSIVRGIQTSMALTGTTIPSTLRHKPMWIGPTLNSWFDSMKHEVAYHG
jgi:isopentenyl-diphosphate delta-isomerase